MRKATSVGRDQLISLGICFGKFTKTGKFRMHVTCLDYIAQYAKVCHHKLAFDRNQDRTASNRSMVRTGWI